MAVPEPEAVGVGVDSDMTGGTSGRVSVGGGGGGGAMTALLLLSLSLLTPPPPLGATPPQASRFSPSPSVHPHTRPTSRRRNARPARPASMAGTM